MDVGAAAPSSTTSSSSWKRARRSSFSSTTPLGDGNPARRLRCPHMAIVLDRAISSLPINELLGPSERSVALCAHRSAIITKCATGRQRPRSTQCRESPGWPSTGRRGKGTWSIPEPQIRHPEGFLRSLVLKPTSGKILCPVAKGLDGERVRVQPNPRTTAVGKTPLHLKCKPIRFRCVPRKRERRKEKAVEGE